MTNYLIRHITDSTGHTFTEVIKPRENENFTVVEAESKEEAERMVLVSSNKNKEIIGKLMKVQRIIG